MHTRPDKQSIFVMPMILKIASILCVSTTSLSANTTWAQNRNSVEQHDIVIYGGTSSGIAAAVQADRMGKSVVLIEPTQFLGGLTTGGLGATDIGNKQAIGGISREFYQRIKQYYSAPEHWPHETRDNYFHNKAPTEDAMWTFEPSAASQVFDAMLKETSVVVVKGERLDLERGVEKVGTQIESITMESQRIFRGKIFIDATYEGDLMAKAGVQFHVGRESNATYGETINGLQIQGAVQHQFVKPVDAYLVPGKPESGLLPNVTPMPSGKDGDGDHRIQAYNFRLCTTDKPDNRRDWPKPDHYNELEYEVLLRNFEAGDLRIPWNPIWMPNRKTDTNNNFAFSTDYIGMNYDYPNGNYALRAKIWKAHENYTKGLMWTLANHPRVPTKVREVFQRIGLARDEFLDNDNWPRQLYVRESRRMISDHVMSEKNCKRVEVVTDSVGMGAYNMDSHNVQRYVTAEGLVRNEGDIQIKTKPYPISYRSIRPKADQCTNLLVPVCLSASHIAYGSIRMEPVFMVMGQSAAIASVHAIDQHCPVQNIDYDKLRTTLEAAGQVLDFVAQPPDGESNIRRKLDGVVVDDSDAKLVGFTHTSSTISPFVGTHYLHDGNEGKGNQSARFQPTLTKAGRYRIAIAYTPNPNRATNVPVTVKHSKGVAQITLNQQSKPEIDGILHAIGEYTFDAGPDGYVEIGNEGTNGHVIVDAVQWFEVQKSNQ